MGSVFERVQRMLGRLQSSKVGRKEAKAERPSAKPPAKNNRRAIFGLTWAIPHEFGGMTSVMLERSTAFGTFLNQDVEILTLNPESDPTSDMTRLRANQKLGPRVSIRNLWSELATAGDDGLFGWFGTGDDEHGYDGTIPSEWKVRSDDQKKTVYETPEGRTQIRYKRTDGSICVIDDRSSAERSLHVFDSQFSLLKSYRRIRDFYFAWFDHIIESRPAIIINESKTVGAYFHSYQRAGVLTAQVLHNSHLEASAPTVYGPFTKSRRKMIVNHERYDIFAFLTIAQKIDFERAFGETINHFVLPNSRELVQSQTEEQRRPAAGVVLASLDERKRVADAISAVNKVRMLGSCDITLDVFGKGPLAEELESLISNLQCDGQVHLRGYTDSVGEVLHASSFLLLTSKAEGMGLVLVEAMARGCIPIAYDVRYGPSDIIEHGVNGFLVEDGNVEALAVAVRNFLALESDQKMRMRHYAQRRAMDFSPRSVIQEWQSAIEVAGSRHWKDRRKRVKFTDAVLRPTDGGDFNVSFEVDDTTEGHSDRDFVVDVSTDDLGFAFCESVDTAVQDGRLTGEGSIDSRKLVAPSGTEYRVYVRELGAALYTRKQVGSLVVP